MKSFNMYLPTVKGKVGVNLNQVLYFETLGRKDYMILKNEERIELMMYVDDIEQILWSQGFYRITRNFLVNLASVQLIFPGNAPKVVLENGKEIFVPQNHRTELFKALEAAYLVTEPVY